LVGLYREYKGYLDVPKHNGAMRVHPDNWKWKQNIFPRFAWTDQHYVPLCAGFGSIQLCYGQC